MMSLEEKAEVMEQPTQITEGRAISNETFAWDQFGCSRNSLEASVAGAERVRRKQRWHRWNQRVSWQSRHKEPCAPVRMRAVGFV